jgi:TolB-like protein
MPTIEVRIFGTFEIRDTAGRLVAVKARKNRALLAALALAPSQSLPRERMTGLLWSDRGDAHARNSLRQALLGLRSDLGEPGAAVLHVDDDKASLNPANVGVDALEFQKLAGSNDVAALRRAYTLYRGELLADTFIEDAVFEEWLGSERRRLADLARSVMERLCAHESGETRIDLAKRLVTIDQLREGSHRLLMQAYLDAGERALALRQYELCRDILRQELQISPGEQIEALRRRCLEQSSPGQRVSAVARLPNQTRPPDPPAFVDDRPLVAVLPFEAFSSEPDMENFCDGLSEDIITGLSRISAIRVVARSTMFTYRHRAVDIRSVGRDLGASYVLEGSVRASARNMRVAAQLIDAVNGHHIWAEQIDLENGEMFELQNEITKSVVASVQTQLILNEGKVIANEDDPERTSNLLARAWRRFLGLTATSIEEAAHLAERALAHEPNNATAHRMIAVAIYHQIYMGFVRWDHQAIDRVFTHAKISIESDGADEYCHWAMECAYLLKGQHDLAVASLHRALQINPNFSLAYGSMGTVLAWSGEYDQSVKSNELALRFNPQDPSNFFRHFGIALAHYFAARPELAVIHARLVVQARSNWWLAKAVYLASLAQADRLADARIVAEELRQQRPDGYAAELAMLPIAKAADRKRFSVDLHRAGLFNGLHVVPNPAA